MMMGLRPVAAVFEFATADLRHEFYKAAVDRGWTPGARGFGDGPVCALRAITSYDAAGLVLSMELGGADELVTMFNKMVDRLYSKLSMATLHAIGLPIPVPRSGAYTIIPPGLWAAMKISFADDRAIAPGIEFAGVRIFDNRVAAEGGCRLEGGMTVDSSAGELVNQKSELSTARPVSSPTIGRKPGCASPKDRACRLALDALNHKATRSPRGRGRLTQLAREVLQDDKLKHYGEDWARKTISSTVRDWESKNPGA